MIDEIISYLKAANIEWTRSGSGILISRTHGTFACAVVDSELMIDTLETIGDVTGQNFRNATVELAVELIEDLMKTQISV